MKMQSPTWGRGALAIIEIDELREATQKFHERMFLKDHLNKKKGKIDMVADNEEIHLSTLQRYWSLLPTI
jgi:hypothetical protein